MFSMTQLIQRQAQASGDEMATQDGTRIQSWSQYVDKVARFAGGLQKLGIGKDDCVAMLALNSDRYFEFMFATPWAGAVFQPINTRLAGPEVVYWLNDSAAKVLIIDSNFIELVAGVKSELTHVEKIVFIDDGEVPSDCVSYADLIDTAPVLLN